jgi:hypothetical protein
LIAQAAADLSWISAITLNAFLHLVGIDIGLAKANASLNGILEDLFQLKEEEGRIHREITTLEKAVKMLNLRSCILDYAVNFGMVHTEKQWHRHLLENGNLTAPVSFDGDYYYCDA